MRRKTKNDIQGILNTLRKAHEQILQQFRKNRPADAQQLLGDCQECAQQIGEAIERSEGMGTQAVSFLEKYCEQLYQMSLCQNRKDQADWKRKMDISLGQVESEVVNSLRTDLLKVVFMPYKASMWDCLESIWESAAADEDCETFVVPIPYFERNDKGGMEKLCYEGPLFPDYVPIVPYETFSLETERPDVIYIHNPYDDRNYVTSVHPDYYSANLKKYTDMLVYVPYFFGGQGPMPESHLNLPVYATADRIIVQDEEKAESLTDYVPREKIAVLGSPKVDRLLKLEKKREEIIKTGIPQEWQEKIAGKKVILFNVSITGILQNSEYAMDKIRYVLSCFEQREDVLLWWRPHPLIEATLKSMRPKMYGEYMKIKKGFVHKGYGILDETGDAGIAAVVADAYLGENSSSLVHYFGVLGKAIYFTNWSIMKEIAEEERAGIFFTDCYFERNYAWFVPRSELAYQYLCKMDLESGVISLEYELPGEFDNQKKGSSYFGIAKVGESVILSPVWSNDIYVYRLNTKQAIKIPLRRSDCIPNFSQVVAFQDKVYLTPRNYPAVIELDIETGVMTEYEVPDPTFDIKRDEKEFLFGIGSVVRDDCIYVPCADRRALLIFDMRSKTYSEKTFENIEAGFYSLTAREGEIWAIGNKTSEVICWKKVSDEVKIYNDFPEGYIGGIQPFRQIVETEKGMLIYPENANMTLFISHDFQKVQECDALKDFVKQEDLIQNPVGMLRYWMVKKANKEIYSLRAQNGGVVRYNIEENRSIIMSCQLQKEDRRRLEDREFDRLFQKQGQPGIYYETLRWSISVFLNYMADQDIYSDKKEKEIHRNDMGIVDGDCGWKIHQWIRNEV